MFRSGSIGSGGMKNPGGPGKIGSGPTGPLPGKSSGLPILATSCAAAFSPLADFALAASPEFTSNLASTAWTLGRASGATATAHCAMIRICSGDATIAVSTIAATKSSLALVASMAAFTTSHAHFGDSETYSATFSKILSGKSLAAFLTSKAIFTQSSSANAAGAAKISAAVTSESFLFMGQLLIGGAGSGNRTRMSNLEG